MSAKIFQAMYSSVVDEINQSISEKGLMTDELSELFGALAVSQPIKSKTKATRKSSGKTNGYRVFVKQVDMEDVGFEDETDDNGKPLKPLARKAMYWKTLSEEEKDVYNKEAERLNAEMSASDTEEPAEEPKKPAKKPAAKKPAAEKPAAEKPKKATKKPVKPPEPETPECSDDEM